MIDRPLADGMMFSFDNISGDSLRKPIECRRLNGDLDGFVLDNVFSPEECRLLVEQADALSKED